MQQSSFYSSTKSKSEPVIDWIFNLLKAGHPIAIGVSFGKDSISVLVLFLEAIKRAKSQLGFVPPCYVTHSNTLIENPALSFYCDEMCERLASYCEEFDLPVSLLKVTPSISATFAYATIGRGKLPRFVNSAHRECSVDWKIRPQLKALKAAIRETKVVTAKPLISLHGSRFSESESRASRMASRGDANTTLVEHTEGHLSNAPIADWTVEDVWTLLMSCDKSRAGVYSTFVPNFERTLSLYRDANEGTCAVVIGDNGFKSPCLSRFGCALCTVSSNEGDKSMESLIATDNHQYDYLRGINRLRNLLVNTQYDLTKRDWLGRTISKAGYARLRPDNYSSEFRRRLLRYLITLDVLEEERAEDHEAALFRGDIEPNETNKRLAYSQFQFVTPQLLIAIDFAWSLQRDFDCAFPALREWFEIRELGRRYIVPDSSPTPRVEIPESRWFYVGAFDHPWMIDGLRDPLGEAVNPKRRPNRVPYMACKDFAGSDNLRRVITHETSDELTVDAEEAGVFVTCEFEDLFYKTLNMDSKSSLLFLLDRGLIKLGDGMAGKYDFVARRAHYYNRLKEELNVSNLTDTLSRMSISDKEHSLLLASVDTQSDEYQQSLF